MAEISKNILATLLIITLVITAVGTWIALSSMTSYGETPVDKTVNGATGKVSVYLLSPPKTGAATGRVTVTLLDNNSEEGG